MPGNARDSLHKKAGLGRRPGAWRCTMGSSFKTSKSRGDACKKESESAGRSNGKELKGRHDVEARGAGKGKRPEGVNQLKYKKKKPNKS